MTTRHSQPQEMKILKLMQVESQITSITRDMEKLMSISAQHGSKIKELMVGMANSVSQVEFMAAITTQRYQSLNIAKQMEQSKAAEAAAMSATVDSSVNFTSTPIIDPRNSSSITDSGEVDKLKVKVSSLETELFDMSFRAEMERKTLENEVKATRTENQELKNSLKVLEDKFEQLVEQMQQQVNAIPFQFVAPEIHHQQSAPHNPESKPALFADGESLEAKLVQPAEINHSGNAKESISVHVPHHSVDNSSHQEEKLHVLSPESKSEHLSPVLPISSHQTQQEKIQEKSVHRHEEDTHKVIDNPRHTIHEQQQPKKLPVQQTNSPVSPQQQTKLPIPGNIIIPEKNSATRKFSVAKPVQIFDDELESGDDLTPMATRPSSRQRKTDLKQLHNNINSNFSGQLSPVITQQQPFTLTPEMKQELLCDIIKGLESMSHVRTLAKQMSVSSVDAVVSHYTRQAIYEAAERGEDVTERLRLARSESEQLSGGLQELQDKYVYLQEETDRLAETARHQTEELALQNSTIEALQSAVQSLTQKLDHNQQRNRRASSLLVNNGPGQHLNHFHPPHLNQQQKQGSFNMTNPAETNTIGVSRKNSMLLPSRKSSKVNPNSDNAVTNAVTATSSSPVSSAKVIVSDSNMNLNNTSSKVDNKMNNSTGITANSSVITASDDNLQAAKKQKAGSFIIKDTNVSTRDVIAAAEATAQAFYPSPQKTSVAPLTKSIDAGNNLFRSSQLAQPSTVTEVQNEDEEENDDDDDKDQGTKEDTKQNTTVSSKENTSSSQATQRVPLRTSILSLTPKEDLFSNNANTATGNGNKNNNAQLQALLQLQQKQNEQNSDNKTSNSNSTDTGAPTVRRSSKLVGNSSRKTSRVASKNNSISENIVTSNNANASTMDNADNRKQILSPPDSPMVRLYSAFDPTAETTLTLPDTDDKDSRDKNINSWLENETDEGIAEAVNETQDESLMSVSLFEAPSEIDPLDAAALLQPLESPASPISSKNVTTNSKNGVKVNVGDSNVASSSNNSNSINAVATNNSSNSNTTVANTKDATTRHLQSLIEALNARLSAIDDHHLLQTSQLNALKVSSAQQYDAIVNCQTLIQSQQHAQQRLHERVARVERVDRDQYFRPLLTSLETFQQAQEEQEAKLTQVAEKMAAVTVEWQSWQHNQALWMTQNQPQSPSVRPLTQTRSLLYSRGHTAQSNGRGHSAAGSNPNVLPGPEQAPKKQRQTETLSLTIDSLLQQGGVGVPRNETVDVSVSKLAASGNNAINTRASLSLESDAGWDTSETPPVPNTTVVFSDEPDDFVNNLDNHNDNNNNNRVVDNGLNDVHVMEIQRQVRFFNNILADLSSRHDALLTQHEALLETVRRGTVLRSRTGRGNSSQSDRVVSVPHVSHNIHPSVAHHNVAETLGNPLHSSQTDHRDTLETQQTVGHGDASVSRDVSPARDTNTSHNNNFNNKNNDIIQNNVQHISQLNQDISRNVHFQRLQKDVLSLRYAVTQAVHLMETHESRLVAQETQQQLQQTQLTQALKPKPFFVSPKKHVPLSSSETDTADHNLQDDRANDAHKPKEAPATFSVTQVPSLMNGRYLVRGREPHIDHLTAKELVDLKLLAESRVSRENNAVPRSPAPPLFQTNTASLAQNRLNGVSFPVDVGLNTHNNTNNTNHQLSRHQRLLLQLQQSHSDVHSGNKVGRYPVSQRHPMTNQPPLVSQSHSWVSHNLQQHSLSTLSHSTSLSNNNEVHGAVGNEVDGKSIWYKDFGEDYYTLEKYEQVPDNHETAGHLLSFGSDVPSSEDPDHLELFPQTQSITLQPKPSDTHNSNNHDTNSGNNSSKNNVSIAVKMKRSLAKSQNNNSNSHNKESVSSAKNKTSKSNAADTPVSIMARYHPASVGNNETAD